MELLTAGLACNGSRLIEGSDGWKLEGDPTEGGVIASALKSGLSHEWLVEKMPTIDTIPFESRYQYMATLHDREDKPQRIYLKGSFESLAMRSSYLLDGLGKQLEFDEQLV
jgi:Ca2+-transporting ATPase